MPPAAGRRSDSAHPRHDPRLSRRLLLQAGGISAGTLALGINAPHARATPLAGDPFTLGVAAGSPGDQSMVLWTRLALDPLAADGHGGMPLENVTVRWEVARDKEFKDVVQRGTAVAQPALAHSVHPQVTGLRPATSYWYRFRVGDQISPVGRFRTLPAAGQLVPEFTLAAASCQAWYHGHFTAHRHLAAESDLDLVVFLGDYIYEYAIVAGDNLWRKNASVTAAEEVEIETLEQYRLRYARFKADPQLQAAHARAAWVFTWDDHEVENGYARRHSRDGIPDALFPHRIAVAYRAFYENLPVSVEALPDGPSTTIYDSYDIGSLARLMMIDGRQHRDLQPTGDDRYDPERTMLGETQERWLHERLQESPARWNMIGNAVSMIPVRPDTELDSWDAYPAARGRLMRSLDGVSNPVVLTGDIHRAVAAELPADLTDPTGRKLAVELICTSIGSDGDGAETDGYADDWLRYPYVRFYHARRGYLLVRLTPEEMTSTYVSVEWVEADDTAPRQVAAAFRTPAGTSRLDPIEGAL
ncbi:alkaline phosphatase D family protein [Microlunatus speluncae]|uniref:alkaline phosphatase D family protein n=1 Tax=Microlunatus speluncae TaxID=2594267 RepID=UPI001FE463A1|nr:alkaline phosphatase D family protein [Microlunatus speluncae]